MRIVYNLRDQNWETTKSLGVLHVSLRMLAGLAEAPGVDRIDILANRSLEALLPRPSAAAGRYHFHFATAPAPRGWGRLLWDQWSVVRRTNELHPDWLLLPKGFAPLVRWPRARVSAYVHDTIFDYYRASGRSPFPRGEAFYFEAALARTAARADSIVTNSAFTAAEVMRCLHPRSTPVPIGAPVSARAPYPFAPETGALLLLVSRWPHKLTGQAIDWLQRWQDETKSPRPVHGVGSLPAGVTWPDRTGWRHHQRPGETEYESLCAQSAALIHFSAYEGYGLPPVEALADGLRAIASDLPPFRETLPAACLFSNDHYASFRQALDSALAGPAPQPLKADGPAVVADRWLAQLGAV